MTENAANREPEPAKPAIVRPFAIGTTEIAYLLEPDQRFGWDATQVPAPVADWVLEQVLHEWRVERASR